MDLVPAWEWNRAFTAELVVDAELGVQALPLSDGGFKMVDGPVCDHGPQSPWMSGGRILHWQGGRIPFLRRGLLEYFRLHTRDELCFARPDFILEEVVHIQRALGVHSIHNAKNVKGHTMPMKHLCRREDLVKRRLAIVGDAIAIVKFFGAVDAQANQESVLFQEGPPLVVQERAIRLEIAIDMLVGPLVFLFQFNYLAEKVQPQQGWLTTLPGENHLTAVLPFDVLADVCFQDFVGDAEEVAGAEELFFVEIVTVCTVRLRMDPTGLIIAW